MSVNDFEKQEKIKEFHLGILINNPEVSQQEKDRAKAELEEIKERKRRRAQNRKPGW